MQKSSTDLGHTAKTEITLRDHFLAEIDSVKLWSKLHKLVEPFYPKVVGARSSADQPGTHAEHVRRPTMLWQELRKIAEFLLSAATEPEVAHNDVAMNVEIDLKRLIKPYGCVADFLSTGVRSSTLRRSAASLALDVLFGALKPSLHMRNFIMNCFSSTKKI